jgi:hypothetical protein
MYASQFWHPSQLVLFGWAVASLNATMSIACANKLMKLPRQSSPLLRLQTERLKLNASRMSPQQRAEHNVVRLQRR